MIGSEYYIIYDSNDNIIAYCDDIDELLRYTGIRKNNLRSRLKIKDYYYYLSNGSYNLIYRFFA